MKQCTCFALKAINCICAERENENSFAHWFYGAPHRIKYLRDHPVFLAAQEAWDAAKKQEAEKQEPVAWVDLLKVAEQIVKDKFLYKQFINGTPLANDIPCWMADFAQQYTHPQPRKE